MPAREPRLRDRARRLRTSSTPEERILWPHLRKLPDTRFRRQVVIGAFICDFACHRTRLVVELDGRHHNTHHDAVRDAWLASRGYRVLRFANDDVFFRMDATLDAIRDAL